MRSPLRLLPLFVLAACSTSKPAASDSAVAAADTGMATANANDEGAAKDAIGKVRASWQENANKKDAATVASYYSDDASFVGTESPVANGRDAIQKNLAQSFAVSNIESIDSKELVVGGDVAYDYGTFRQRVTPPKGPATTVNGYYLVTLRRQPDGSWKITRHVSTTPPVTP